jgi:hypothetical protein
MSVVIVGLFFLSWVWFDIYIFLLVLKKLDHLSNSTIHELRFTAMFIAQTSCTYNFFIYLIFNNIYRQNFKPMILKCLCSKPPGVETSSDKDSRKAANQFQCCSTLDIQTGSELPLSFSLSSLVQCSRANCSSKQISTQTLAATNKPASDREES